MVLLRVIFNSIWYLRVSLWVLLNAMFMYMYLKFFAFQHQEHKKLLNFFFPFVFSNCAFLTLPWLDYKPTLGKSGEIIHFLPA